MQKGTAETVVREKETNKQFLQKLNSMCAAYCNFLNTTIYSVIIVIRYAIITKTYYIIVKSFPLPDENIDSV